MLVADKRGFKKKMFMRKGGRKGGKNKDKRGNNGSGGKTIARGPKRRSKRR